MTPAYLKIPRHLQDYLAAEKKLQPFYSQPLLPDWKDLADRVTTRFKQKDIVAELIAQNQPSASKQAERSCRLLEEDKTVVVITGQQLGLMLSPLYIIYKTLTTIWLTERLNKMGLGHNFVPVFWLEGEDHDYDEVKSLNFPQMNGELLTLMLDESAAEQGMSVNKRQLSVQISTVLQDLKEALQPTDFREQLFGKLQSIYQPGKNWLQAFKEHMAVMFSDSGLLFFNAGSEKVKELSSAFFREMLRNNAQIVSCFSSQSKRLEQAGYQNQVNVQQGRSYLFFTKNGMRLPLLFENNSFFVQDTGESFPMAEALRAADEHPDWFSSTVLSRPLWQSYLLPVVSYVAGAAEIAYWGQLKSAFEAMNIVMPHLQPRHSVTLLEPRIDRLLNKYELDINTVPADRETLVKEYFAGTHLRRVTNTLNDFAQHAEKSRDEVKKLISAVDPTLQAPAEKSYDSILGTINKLQNRLSHAISQKESTVQNHLNAIHESILPGGTLQERLISPVYFENKYGPDWLKKVSQHFNENFGSHLVVRL